MAKRISVKGTTHPRVFHSRLSDRLKYKYESKFTGTFVGQTNPSHLEIRQSDTSDTGDAMIESFN